MPRFLTRREKYCYGVGHVLNDLCASMWFSYLLVFFHEILQFSNSMAGNILLVGQLADGLATPFVGYESDHSSITCRYGKRKSWHLVGSVSVALTFPLLFMSCIGCEQETAEYAQFVYYAPLVIIFQFGWASTQINHLALIPDLTHKDSDKVTLNAIRYSFTVISCIIVYSVAWGVLDMPSSPSSKSSTLSPADAPAFRTLVLIVVGIGIIFTLTFHLGLKENVPPQAAVNGGYTDIVDTVQGNEENGIIPVEDTPLITKPQIITTACSIRHWYDWFKKPQFYLMAMLYMCTRLIVNLSQVYIPMYLTETLMLHKRFIAIVPLVVFVSSFFAAILIRPISSKVKQEVMYMVGCFFVLGSCVWAQFLPEHNLMVFGMAVLLGTGTSVILVMSLSMLAKLIGKATGTGAFVYGAMSLTDKVSNGAAVVIIQNLNPCLCECPACGIFFRNIMVFVIGGITVMALLTLAVMSITKMLTPVTFVKIGQDDDQVSADREVMS